MFVFRPPTTITPDGGGIYGGVTLTASGLSEGRSESYSGIEFFTICDGLSEGRGNSDYNVDGYGVRRGASVGRSSSTLDIGRGLIVINESGIQTTNTTVLRFYGDTLYSGQTLNKNSDATVTTSGCIEIDGGDANSAVNTDILDGGNTENTNLIINGGNATPC